MNEKKSNMLLRRFHARGKRKNEIGARRKLRKKVTWGNLEMLGAKTPTAKNRLMEARKFARLCDDEGLDYLCGLVRANGKRLTRTHILQLIRVDMREQRMDLAAKCAKKSWSTRALQNEIDRQGRHRPYGGRKQKPPESVDVELLVTDRLLSSVIRWASVVRSVESGTGK